MPFYQKETEDCYSTPLEYLQVIEPFISKSSIICDPFYFNGFVKEEWKKLNRDIIHEDKDFFQTQYACDIFVSNPPYSILNEVLSELFKRDKPFALLIPIQKIAQLKIQKIIKNKNIQVVVSPIYIGFVDKHNNKTRCPSQYFCWLTYRMNLQRDLLFIQK